MIQQPFPSLGSYPGCYPGGDLLTVKILLEDAADLNAVDNTGRTPLMFAAGAGHLEAVLKGRL